MQGSGHNINSPSIKLNAALDEEAISIDLVLQELIEDIDCICIEVPPACADSNVEFVSNLIFQNRFDLIAPSRAVGR